MELKDYTSTVNFLKHLYRKCGDEGFVNFRFIIEKENVAVNQYLNLTKIEQTSGKLNRHKGHDMFCGVSLRSGYSGRKIAISKIPAVWLDHDNVTPEVEAQLKSFPLQPSIIVRSSLPTKRHFYWILKTPLGRDSIQLVESINKRLVSKFNGDPNACDASRVLRLPGTLNLKYNPPLSCEVLESNNNEFELSEFDPLLPPLPLKSSSLPDHDWKEEILQGVEEGKRTLSAAKLVGSCISKGFSYQETHNYMMGWDFKNDPPLGESEIEATIESMAKTHLGNHPEWSWPHSSIVAGPNDEGKIQNQEASKDKHSFSRGEGRTLFEILNSKEEPPNCLIEPWLAVGEKGYLSASYKVGKTSLQMGLTLHAAIGDIDWLGFYIPKPIKVLNIRFELADWKFSKRLRMMVKGLYPHTVKKAPIFELVRGFEITNHEDQDWLFKMIDKHEPDLLTLDPLYKMTALSLSDPSKGPLVVRAFDKIRERYKDLAIQSAHHNKKKQGNQTKKDFDSDWDTSYGVFQIFADMDYQIKISSDGKEDPTFRWEFMSNDEPVSGFNFKRNPDTLLYYRVECNPEESKVWKKFNQEIVNFIVEYKKDHSGQLPIRKEVIEAMPESRYRFDDARKKKLNRGWKEVEVTIEGKRTIQFDVCPETPI